MALLETPYNDMRTPAQEITHTLANACMNMCPGGDCQRECRRAITKNLTTMRGYPVYVPFPQGGFSAPYPIADVQESCSKVYDATDSFVPNPRVKTIMERMIDVNT